MKVGEKILTSEGELLVVSIPDTSQVGVLDKNGYVNFLSESMGELNYQLTENGLLKNLAYNDKFDCWTVTWESDMGDFKSEPDTVSEVLELLQDLSRDGINEEYINIFPPKSNMPYEEFMKLIK